MQFYGLRPIETFEPEEIETISINEVPEVLRNKLLETDPDIEDVFVATYPPSDVYAVPGINWDMQEDNVSSELQGLEQLGNIEIFGSYVTFYKREDPNVPGYGLFWYNPGDECTAFLITF